MSRPQSMLSAEPSDPAVSPARVSCNAACFPGRCHYELQAESPIVNIKIFKRGPERYLAVSGQVEVIAFGATPEEAAEAFVADASYQVQLDRYEGRSGLIDVSKASHWGKVMVYHLCGPAN